MRREVQQKTAHSVAAPHLLCSSSSPFLRMTFRSSSTSSSGPSSSRSILRRSLFPAARHSSVRPARRPPAGHVNPPLPLGVQTLIRTNLSPPGETGWGGARGHSMVNKGHRVLQLPPDCIRSKEQREITSSWYTSPKNHFGFINEQQSHNGQGYIWHWKTIQWEVEPSSNLNCDNTPISLNYRWRLAWICKYCALFCNEGVIVYVLMFETSYSICDTVGVEYLFRSKRKFKKLHM